MKKTKIYLLALVVVAFISSIYFVGCKQNTSEPLLTENSLSSTNSLRKCADIDLATKKKLLQKFFQEVDDAKIKIKAKYDKLRRNNMRRVNALPLHEQEAIELAAAITPSAYSYVNSSYGVDLHEFFAPDDANIALVGVMIGNVEADNYNGIFYEDINDPIPATIISQTDYKRSNGMQKSTTSILARPLWAECMDEALGVSGWITLVTGGCAEALSWMGAYKLARKTFYKYLGGFGAAIALAEFIWCMNRD